MTGFAKLIFVLVLSFDKDIVADAKVVLDAFWCIKSNHTSMGHYTHAVGQLIGFLDMLSAHND